ncbi:hypothetical protein [Halovivax cerinus]|uniref:Cohesin domain-containing protein n=1 Tax=Halovivax cerinus TaxID=1487865 RepID=A0ABD5NKA7_9EURY|nr:hypothetical protein [Halovivax cerinus]
MIRPDPPAPDTPPTPVDESSVSRRVPATVAAAALAILLTLGVVATPVEATTAAERSNQTILVGDATTTPGQGASVDVVLTDAPDGLAGYELTLTLEGDGVASIQGVSYPSEFGLTSNPVVGPEGRSITVEAADVEDEIVAGDRDVTLVTIDVTGHEPGETSLSVTGARLDADGGDAIDVSDEDGTIAVGGEDADGELDDRDTPAESELPGFGPIAALTALGWAGWRRYDGTATEPIGGSSVPGSPFRSHVAPGRSKTPQPADRTERGDESR